MVCPVDFLIGRTIVMITFRTATMDRKKLVGAKAWWRQKRPDPPAALGCGMTLGYLWYATTRRTTTSKWKELMDVKVRL